MNKPFQQIPHDGSSEAATHRSFRLTPGASLLNDDLQVGSARSAVLFAATQQLLLLLLSALLLDGGLILKQVIIAAIAYWVMALLIIVRRSSHFTNSDIVILKWGYIPLLSTTTIIWFLQTFTA